MKVIWLTLTVGLLAACNSSPVARSEGKTCTLMWAASLSVTLTDKSTGARICDATVTATLDARKMTLDPWCGQSICNYLTPSNDPGHYRVQITHPAYRSETLDVDVAPGECAAKPEYRTIALEAKQVELPAWAVGTFHANLPGIASAINLRLGPGADFEWALTSLSPCDFSAGDVGIIGTAPEKLELQSLGGVSKLRWPSLNGVREVDRVTVVPGLDGTLISESSNGSVEWSPGTDCGCGEFKPCDCLDPFSPSHSL